MYVLTPLKRDRSIYINIVTHKVLEPQRAGRSSRQRLPSRTQLHERRVQTAAPPPPSIKDAGQFRTKPTWTPPGPRKKLHRDAPAPRVHLLRADSSGPTHPRACSLRTNSSGPTHHRTCIRGTDSPSTYTSSRAHPPHRLLGDLHIISLSSFASTPRGPTLYLAFPSAVATIENTLTPRS